MKILTFFVLVLLSLVTQAQVCSVDMVDRHGRIVRSFSAYGDPHTCMEGMKECRKTIRTNPGLGGVDCLRRESIPIPQPTSYPTPHPTPYPTAYPTPIPFPTIVIDPYPNSIPQEVLRMDLIDQAIHFALQDCHVLPRVAGWANQLYIRGNFSGNYQDGPDDMKLMRVLRDYQMQGVCILKPVYTLRMQFERPLIQEAINFKMAQNCYVIERAAGWANQLYINGNFSGNFDVNSVSSQYQLASILADSLASGKCHPRTFEELRLLDDPYLIQDFANFQYRGCEVKLNVAGWAHQLYVNGSFSGNFDNRTEVKKLQNTLVNLIMSGRCVYDPI